MKCTVVVVALVIVCLGVTVWIGGVGEGVAGGSGVGAMVTPGGNGGGTVVFWKKKNIFKFQ